MSKSLLENFKNYAQVYTTYITCFARKSKFLHLKKFHNGYLYLSQDKIY